MSSLILHFRIKPASLTASISYSSTRLELPFTSWLQQNHLHDSNEAQTFQFSQNSSIDKKKDLLPEHDLQTKDQHHN
jgi:hypothetical protein